MRRILGVLVIGLLVAVGGFAAADEIAVDEFDVEATASPLSQARPQARDDSWYYKPQQDATTPEPARRTIAQERAIARGNQRSARMASMAWYGMYNGRPTAAPIPFCTPLYGPAWQSPYGAGFSWRMGQPTYVVTSRSTDVVR
jgi:hypothetical protein